MWYIEENGSPVPCDDLQRASEWLFGPGGGDRRRVRETKIKDDEIYVSTVFLGLDHSFGGASPVLYETMIFGGQQDGYQRRYHFRDEAVAGHEEAVQIALGNVKDTSEER